MNKNEIEKDLMEIVDNTITHKNWDNLFDTKELFTFKEGKIKVFDSYLTYKGNMSEELFRPLDNAEYFIFKSFKSNAHIFDYCVNGEKNETWEKDLNNKPFIVSRDLLITTTATFSDNFIFHTEKDSVGDYAKENISKLYDFDELFENTEALKDFIAIDIGLERLIRCVKQICNYEKTFRNSRVK